MTWRLKACPRCGGDTYIVKDNYNIWFEQCLQCGFMRELKKVEVKAGEQLKKRPINAG